MADRNSLYALAVNAAAERSPFGHPLAEAELRAVYAAVDAVVDALESGGSTTCTCPSGDGSLRWPCPQHPPTNARPRAKDEED